MRFTKIVHIGQFEVFPHITICLGSECEDGTYTDSTLVYIGWLIFDLCIEIPRREE